MANLPFKGLKHLSRPGAGGKPVWLVFGAVTALVVALYFFVFHTRDQDEKDIYHSVIKSIHQVEHAMEKKTGQYRKRAQAVFRRYLSNRLEHSEMKPKEALIIEQNGVIRKYLGEIYYYKFKPMKTGDWAFIEKNRNIYYMTQLAGHVFYVRYFCNLDENMSLEIMGANFADSEIRFSPTPLDQTQNEYQYDDIRDLFIYRHCLKPSNNQLILYLKFSRFDVGHFNRLREKVFIHFCIILYLLLLVWVRTRYRKNPVFTRVVILALLVDLFFLLPLLLEGTGKATIYLKFYGGAITLQSIFQLLVAVFFAASVCYFLRKQLKIKIISYILFNVLMVVALRFSDRLFNAVYFNYQEVSVNYLGLLLTLYFLHLIPLVFIRGMAYDFYRHMKNPGERLNKGIGYLMAQSMVAVMLSRLLDFNMISALVVSLVSFILLFFKRRFFSRAAVIFFLAVSIYHLTSTHALREKEEFITGNLKMIFLNQSNYAKFIAREIVHQINLDSENLAEFFQGDSAAKLETIWRKTIASRENIASGIFVVSPEGEVLNFFTFQISPYLKAKTRNIFPFWAIEDTTAEIHGKEIPLAAASTSIYKESENLGRIMVQVLNSPELLLRYQENINIFTIDNKIDGKDLSYIKLNAKNQVLENPSNINLENVSGILKAGDEWIEFESMEMEFKGYIFKDGGNTVIIFFPRHTIFKELSDVIKLFLFFSVFYLLFFMKDLGKINWSTLYYSYSIRVFVFLIFISLVTAVVFSIFFINFSYRNSEQKVMRIMYENGRTAQNMGYNLIKGQGQFDRGHLFTMADILNGDVTVYDRREGFLKTSNYRKVLDSRIPLFLHSQTQSLLNEKNQRFVLIEDRLGFHLSFKIYDYIFMVEYSNKWEEELSAERYYTDFIITLFFMLTIIGISTALFFRKKILAPIDGLNRGMSEVERGDLPVLTELPSETEIRTLYTGFNAMIDGIREQKKNISELSRMKTIIRLGRHVAHEVKNPLTPIKLSAEQILMALRDKNPNYEEIILQSVNYIIDETEHLRRVSYGFLDLSKLDEVAAEPFDLMILVREEMFSVRQIYSNIRFEVICNQCRGVDAESMEVPVTLDKIKIKQVMKNLINNSIEAIGDREGEIRLSLHTENNRVRIEVRDNGSGMDEEDFERVFEKDYSTKEIGTGLGLFIVKRIVELHKGTITIDSRKNEGTTVIMDLPVTVGKAESG
jgi:signal transduction histidine kinase